MSNQILNENNRNRYASFGCHLLHLYSIEKHKIDEGGVYMPAKTKEHQNIL